MGARDKSGQPTHDDTSMKSQQEPMTGVIPFCGMIC